VNPKTDSTAKIVYGYNRVSSKPQTWGDGERRQDEQLQQWCARKGWTLSDRRFRDRGVSAWKGRNRQEGALAELLKVAKAGDVIAIEDNDRFSRERTTKSLVALEEIVNRGVMVAFIKTGVEVTKENFNDPAVLIPNFFQSFLANQENEKRSYRIKQAMEKKRQQIADGKLPFGRLPAWLRWDAPPKKPRKIVVIKEKATLVSWIFELCAAGKGVRCIERQLRNCPPIANSKNANWNSRFIHRLLRDKSVLGYYAPTETPNIFPVIVDEGKFYAAGAALDGRRHQTVRQSCADHNLFTGLLRCAACGNTLVRHTTHARGHDYTYLLCSGRLRGLAPECSAAGLRYDLFEQSFLSLMAHGQLMRMILSERQEGPSALDILKGKLANAEREAAKFMDFIKGDPNPARAVYNALKEAEAKADDLRAGIEAEVAKKWSAVATLEVWEKVYKLLVNGIEPLTPYSNHPDGQALLGRANALIERVRTLAQPAVLKPENRAQLREMIREVVDRVVAHLGCDRYEVYLKGSQQPIEVVLDKKNSGWGFSPAPLWVTDPSSYQQKAATGEFTNVLGAVGVA